jgi:hypothetical protein
MQQKTGECNAVSLPHRPFPLPFKLQSCHISSVKNQNAQLKVLSQPGLSNQVERMSIKDFFIFKT